jgi:hypothetical protein
MKAFISQRRFRIWIAAGLIAFATWATGPRAAHADLDFGATFSFISNAYGAFQAGQFILSALGIFHSDDLDAAKREILAAIQNTQIEDLAGTVDGILSTFETVVASPGNPYNMGLVIEIISESDIVIGRIRQALAEKNLDKSYRLAVPFNAIVVTNAMAKGIAGYSSSVVQANFASTLQINYGLVGADQVQEPSGQIRNTSDTGFLWKKFNNVWHQCQSCSYPEWCNMKQEYCNLHADYCSIPTTRPYSIGIDFVDDPVCWNETWLNVFWTFIRDPVVAAVRRANIKLMQQGFVHVTDSQGTAVILSASDLDKYPECRRGRCHF